MVVKMANATASGNRLNALEIWLGYFLIAVKSILSLQVLCVVLEVIREAATEYAGGIMRRLREHEYNPELMKLYVVGGGSCLIRNFAEYDPSRVTINSDICATAKGYELLAQRNLGGTV